MNSKFKLKDNRPLKVKVLDFLESLLFWKGRKKGIIHTRDVTLDDFRYIFFPKKFHEKYGYLGAMPWNEDGQLFKAMEPLVIFMDYKAKPKWCPRWFLRFLHVFGSDKSIVRVRNRTLHNLHHKLTKGIFMYDYKTKWQWYDLRISVSGNKQIQDLADDIEAVYYRKGQKQDLLDEIYKYNPAFDKPYWTTKKLAVYLDDLIDKKEESEKN
jgi:hypothetical protein